MPPAVDLDVPHVDWSAFIGGLDWRQGEHVTLVGPTGQGKTTLALGLARYRLHRRGFVAAVGTKPKDATLASLKRRHGWKVVGDWRDVGGADRVVLWPRWRGPQDTPAQANAINRGLLDAAFKDGRWCLVVDDVQYLCDQLRLAPTLATIWLQARSLKVSLVGATQRPVRAPREMFSQASHYFLWGTADDEDLRSLAGFGMADTKAVRAQVARLAPHDVLYVDGRRPGVLAVTRAPRYPLAA